MAVALRVLLLLTALARCGSFLVAPSPLVPGIASRPERASCRHARHRGPPRHLMSTSGNSPEDIDEVRQRLMASSNYDEMVGRIEGNSPFLEAGDNDSTKEGEESPVLPVFRQTVRVVVDVAITLVPVVLVVTYAKLPPPLLEALGSAATAIKGSPLEPVFEALPWEPAVVLKAAAQGGVAVLLSPVTDRLVVSPAIHQWVQAKLRSLSS
ncbi:unnamed protein product [Ectocarpus sp. 6 AP-2014]